MNAPQSIAVMHWTAVDVALPDDEMTVLVAVRGEAEAWPAFILDGKWFYASGDPISNVYAWTSMVEVPKEFA